MEAGGERRVAQGGGGATEKRLERSKWEGKGHNYLKHHLRMRRDKLF